jgi:DNA-directed RNA polymerase specialized sigma24 family protein
MKESPVKIDILLEPLLAEASPEQADELLSQLITVHAEPVIKAVIRYKLRFSTNRETQRPEAYDIQQEVVLQLLAQLQRFRKLPDSHPITDLRGMTAVIAHRTCARWLRRQFPERHALKNPSSLFTDAPAWACALARSGWKTRRGFCSLATTTKERDA